MPRGRPPLGSAGAFPRSRPRENGDAGDVASRAREARREAGLDRIATDPNDRDRTGRCTSRFRDGVIGGDDHVRLSVDDLASEIGIARGPALA